MPTDVQFKYELRKHLTELEAIVLAPHPDKFFTIYNVKKKV